MDTHYHITFEDNSSHFLVKDAPIGFCNSLTEILNAEAVDFERATYCDSFKLKVYKRDTTFEIMVYADESTTTVDQFLTAIAEYARTRAQEGL